MQFGLSTHIFHDRRVTRGHLLDIASHGFDRLELFATRSHFDYRDARAIADLQGWLRDAGLALHSMHAPIVERHVDGQWLGPLSLAAGDEATRAHAVAETAATLEVARTVPYGFLVVHLGVPDDVLPPGVVNSPTAAIRSLEQVSALAAPVGVEVAVEVIPNRLSSAAALVHLIDEEIDLPHVGICLDFGHAAIMGDVVEAVETVSGLLATTHVHDNRGREDEHLAPFEGATDWDAALTALRKVGYEGTLMLEVAGAGDPAAVLGRAREARRRLEGILSA